MIAVQAVAAAIIAMQQQQRQKQMPMLRSEYIVCISLLRGIFPSVKNELEKYFHCS